MTTDYHMSFKMDQIRAEFRDEKKVIRKDLYTVSSHFGELSVTLDYIKQDTVIE